jgi:hypothetical protein
MATIDPTLLVAVGNPFDGVTLHGGFKDAGERHEFTEGLRDETWWYPTVQLVQQPEQPGGLWTELSPESLEEITDDLRTRGQTEFSVFDADDRDALSGHTVHVVTTAQEED